MNRFMFSAVAAMLTFTTEDAKGESIATLRSTGMSDAGTPLPDYAVDPHYVLTEVPAGSGFGPKTHIVDSTLYPIATEEWMANSATSTWISAQADQSAFPNDVGQGNYAFRTTFDLAGFDPASAQISGQWAVDDVGLDILINGASTGHTHHQTLTFGSFSITAGFVAGLNTLDFLVRNEPFAGDINPMGLRVELSGTADPVPVPATLTLLPDPVSATASSTYPEDVLTYGPQNLYDQNPTASTLNKMIDIGAEYAGVGEGPHVVVFDYGIPVSFDGVAYAQRALGAEPDADRVPAINFWVSDTDPGPAALDLPILLDAPAATVANINMDDLRFRAYSFGQELTGQYVVFRLEAGGTFNPGGGELMLLRNLLSGDFNGDGGVDAADYVVWRKTGGTQDDYDAWRTNFGRTLAGSGSAGYSLGASAESRSAAVPEPLASAAAVLGLAGLMMFRTASARVVSRVRFW